MIDLLNFLSEIIESGAEIVMISPPLWREDLRGEAAYIPSDRVIFINAYKFSDFHVTSVRRQGEIEPFVSSLRSLRPQERNIIICLIAHEYGHHLIHSKSETHTRLVEEKKAWEHAEEILKRFRFQEWEIFNFHKQSGLDSYLD